MYRGIIYGRGKSIDSNVIICIHTLTLPSPLKPQDYIIYNPKQFRTHTLHTHIK